MILYPFEKWKYVPGWRMYAVSDHGRVARVDKSPWKVYLGHMNNSGYRIITLTDSPRVKGFTVQNLILRTFIGEPPPKFESLHIDGNKLNNRLFNLKWGSKPENQRDRAKHGTDPKGERHGCSVLKEEDVLEIRKLYAENKLTNTQIGERFGISRSHVSGICTRRFWKHV